MLFERIIMIIDLLLGGNKKAFSDRIGVPQTTFLGYLEEDGQSKIRVSLLEKILHEFPQINRYWFFFGEGQPFEPSIPSLAKPDPVVPVLTEIPLTQSTPDEVAALRAEITALTKDLIHAQQKIIDLHEQLQQITSEKNTFLCQSEVPVVGTGSVLGVREDGRR